MGRLYAFGQSIQKLTKSARYATFDRIGYDIDMKNTSFSLLRLTIMKYSLEEKFPILKAKSKTSTKKENIGEAMKIKPERPNK